jgi:hypothetical protein
LSPSTRERIPRSLAELLQELDTLAGRLDLVLDRLAGAVDPANGGEAGRTPVEE